MQLTKLKFIEVQVMSPWVMLDFFFLLQHMYIGCQSCQDLLELPLKMTTQRRILH